VTRRPTLRDTITPPASEAAQAAAAARQLQRQQDHPTNGESEAMATSTIHIPVDLLNALRAAANRRSMRRLTGRLTDRRNTRPSVSEIVVELLTRHRAELDELD
jgi:hypothetical protein